MTYDGELDIAIGLSARSKVWSNRKLKWSELVSRLGEENKTTETFKEFVSASKGEQLKIKDVGGYVGGYLRGGQKKPGQCGPQTVDDTRLGLCPQRPLG